MATFAILSIILRVARWHRPDGPLSVDEIIDQLSAIALNGVLKEERLTAQAVLSSSN